MTSWPYLFLIIPAAFGLLWLWGRICDLYNRHPEFGIQDQEDAE